MQQVGRYRGDTASFNAIKRVDRGRWISRVPNAGEFRFDLVPIEVAPCTRKRQRGGDCRGSGRRIGLGLRDVILRMQTVLARDGKEGFAISAAQMPYGLSLRHAFSLHPPMPLATVTLYHPSMPLLSSPP